MGNIRTSAVGEEADGTHIKPNADLLKLTVHDWGSFEVLQLKHLEFSFGSVHYFSGFVNWEEMAPNGFCLLAIIAWSKMEEGLTLVFAWGLHITEATPGSMPPQTQWCNLP